MSSPINDKGIPTNLRGEEAKASQSQTGELQGRVYSTTKEIFSTISIIFKYVIALLVLYVAVSLANGRVKKMDLSKDKPQSNPLKPETKPISTQEESSLPIKSAKIEKQQGQAAIIAELVNKKQEIKVQVKADEPIKPVVVEQELPKVSISPPAVKIAVEAIDPGAKKQFANTLMAALNAKLGVKDAPKKEEEPVKPEPLTSKPKAKIGAERKRPTLNFKAKT